MNSRQLIKTFTELDDKSLSDEIYNKIKNDLLVWQKLTLKRPKTNNYLISLVSGTDDDEDSDDISSEDPISENEKIMLKLNSYKIEFLLKNNYFCPEEENFATLFVILFSRSSISYLELVEKYFPGRVLLNSHLLEKIVVYGRYRVLEFLQKYYKPKLLELLSEKNPYDIDEKSIGLNHRYIQDVWNGWTWGNDEYEKPVIKQTEINHFKIIEILDIFKSEHKTLIDLNEEILKKWIKNSLCNLYVEYILDYKQILSHFFPKISIDNLQTREDIVNIVDIIGYDYTWKILKNKNDSNILKILL